MSDLQNQPSTSSRGRVSARGGRGGFSSRGGRGGSSRSVNDNSDLSSFDEGEIGQMKKKYADTLPTLKEMFPNYKVEDLAFALQDCNGELMDAIERLSEGNVSQWGEVKKKTTERKPKEVPASSTDPTVASARGGRGRGGLESRGRARGDRGRGGRGGRAGLATNGSRAVSGVEASAPISTPASTSASNASQAKESAADPSIEGDWESIEPPKNSSVISEGPKKGWAGLFAKPPPPPVQTKPQTVTSPAVAPVTAAKEAVSEPAAPAAELPLPDTETAAPAASQKTPIQKPTHAVIPAVPTASVNTPKRDLTSTNLEQIPDVSAPAPTATAASTIGSGIDPGAAAAAGGYSRIPSSAYPASATKPARTPGLQRRVMEQQQAVVMPGNHAVDRAAVQFGSMGLNGDALDIDENREQAETRAQPPQHSPVAPRASLPPAAQTPQSLETGAAGRPAPGLPPVPQASATDSFTDFARYSEPQQKPFDPFTQQVSQPQQQIAEPFANQAPVQPTTAGSEYSPFHAADNRIPYYGSYGSYGSYGQTQDAPTGPRAGVGFGVSGAETQPQIPTTQPPSRYGIDNANSGHNTPNPPVLTPAMQHGYGYNGSNYYNNPYYASYMNQYNGRTRPMYDDARRYEEHYMHPQHQQQHQQQQHSQQQYYNQYYGKAGMPPAAFSYDQTSSSPANTGSFSQAMPTRESVYGRTGSAPQSDNITPGANSFSAGMPDVFSRSQASFGQNPPPLSGQPPAAGDESKAFEAPKAGGPSPSLAQNRPGSATNSGPGQSQPQSGFPPQVGQQGQQAFGGTYPYGGLGGLQGAANQTHQASAYGNYAAGAGAGAGFSNYYGNTGRGGWGGNYGH